MQSCSCLRWTLFFSSSTVSEFISKRLCFLQILEKKLRMSSIVRIKYDYDRSTILLQYCKWELFIFRPQRQLSLFLCSSGAPSSVPLSLSKLVDDDNTSRRHCGNHTGPVRTTRNFFFQGSTKSSMLANQSIAIQDAKMHLLNGFAHAH
jgi:hypothetical protein